jgi:eukaryotic-like serine/threonine-protein kinase
MTHPPPGQSADAPSRGSHLDSWKEIAAYLKRDIRTVQRWEKLEGLPVHRHQHDERGTAYAYSAEIDEWLSRRRRERAPERRVATRARGVTPLFYWGVAVVVGAIALLMWGFAGARDQPSQLSSLSVVFPPSEQFYEWGPDMALSPDGSTLVYMVRSRGFQLHLRRLDQLESRALPGTAPAIGPFFSPDGRWVGFFQNGVLKKVAVDGGIPVPLDTVDVRFIGAADWGSDDQIVYANMTPAGTHGLYRVAAEGGTPALIAELDGQAEDTYWLTPQSMAGGTAVLCTIAKTTSTGARFQVAVVSVATGERRVLIEDARHGLYLGNGVLVYWQRESLFATRFDTTRLAVSGPRVPAWDGVGERVRLRSWAYAAGTLVYWPALRVEKRLVWVDRAGKVEPLALPPAQYGAPRISPDGKSVAFKIGGEFGNVWTHSLVDGSTAQLTFDDRSGSLIWTPDGSGLTLATLHAGGGDLVQVRADGTVPPEPLPLALPEGFHKQPRSWLRGGRTLLVGVSAEPSLWTVSLDGGEPRSIRNDSVTYGQVSPDERWLAYVSGASGRREVYVAPFPAGHAQWKVSADGGDLPLWAKSGRELFYRDGQHVMAVPIAAGDTFAPGAPQMLFSGRFYEGEPGGPNYDISPDGQRFLMVLPGSTEGPDRLNVVQGWKAEIERRLQATR